MTGTITGLPINGVMSAQQLSMPSLRSVKLSIEDDSEEYAQYEEGEGNGYFAAVMALFVRTPITRLYFLDASSTYLPPILDGMRVRALCFPSVTELYWGVDPESDDDALVFIRAFPAVRCFNLCTYGATTILNTLIGSNKVGAQALWYHLHTVYLNDPDISKARQLVESRIKMKVPLRCLRLRKPKPKGHIDDLQWLSSRLEVVWVASNESEFEGTE